MAGLPVLTCMGNAFPARVASSLLHAVGLPEMITESLADYEALAVALVQDGPRLAALKHKLQANRATHPLFDTPRFCRHLEQALLGMAQQIGATTLQAAPPLRRLHIGGKVRAEGWELMNVQPGAHVDHLGNANDLARFAAASFDVLYASHVLEHFDYQHELANTLREWHRVLKPGGTLMVSVPDLAVLAGLMLDPKLSMVERFITMRMIFGGHVDAHDHHRVGLTEEFLQAWLGEAGFSGMQRVAGFGLFADASETPFAGRRISLNVA
jgi:predicted SAM-dependent methyltransferase